MVHGLKYVALLYSLIFVLFVSSCTIESRHKTLTFFFDGVDKPDPSKPVTTADSMTLLASLNKIGVGTTSKAPQLVIHKPYYDRKCDLCHTPDKQLIMPMPNLCFKCHMDFKNSVKYIHGPVAAGACTKCHHQHSAPFAKLLIKEGQGLCNECHQPSQLFANKYHRDIEDAACTVCHNPHGGNGKNMLRENLDDNIALKNERMQKHLVMQVYNETPGDVNTKMIQLNIINKEGELISSSFADANGAFALINMHPGVDYYFNFSTNLPITKLYLTNSEGKVLYTVYKNSSGKYYFDRLAYYRARTALFSTDNAIN